MPDPTVQPMTVPSYRDRIFSSYASRGAASAPTFDAAAADRWGRIYDHYLRGWLPADRSARIADVACGAGGLLRFFQSRGYGQLDGVDVSGEQVTIARAVVPGVVEGDVVEFLKQRPGSFDLVTAFDIIEHLTKDEVFALLDACHTALRPGGRLILQTPNADSPFFGTIRYGDFTHETCFTPHSLGWVLGLCGFRGTESRECGPRPLGVKAAVRTVLWKSIRAAIRLVNLAETGAAGSGVFTRVFLISGTRT